MTGNERAEEIGDGALPADPDISIRPPDEDAPEKDDPSQDDPARDDPTRDDPTSDGRARDDPSRDDPSRDYPGQGAPRTPDDGADTTADGALSPGSTATGSPTSLGE